MSFSFLELSKFHKKFDELENNIEKWAYFFKHANDIEPEDLKKVWDEDSALSEAYKALEMSVYTQDQLLEYERYAWKEEEIQNRINDAIKQSKEEGLAEGRAEGEKIGIEKGKVEGEKIGIEKGEKIGIEKGKVEGEKIGIEKGAKEAKIETAKNALALGLSIEQVSKISGLSVDEVVAIKNS